MTDPTTAYSNRIATYRIKVLGPISESWYDRLGGMKIVYQTRSDAPPLTTLVGPVADQAALRGILSSIWDLNLTLVSVTRLENTRDAAGKEEGAM